MHAQQSVKQSVCPSIVVVISTKMAQHRARIQAIVGCTHNTRGVCTLETSIFWCFEPLCVNVHDQHKSNAILGRDLETRLRQDQHTIIGASLSKLHINSTAMRELYIMVRWSHRIIYPAWLYRHKCKIILFYCTFSCLG